MLQLDVRSNISQLLASIDRARLDQLPQALAWTLTDLAYQARSALIAEMARVFDRPTPFTLNSLFVVAASKRKLVASVEFKDFAAKGVSPNRYLQAEIEGGPRRLKRFERALQAAGLMPKNLFCVPAAGASLDAYGNLPGPYLVRILSQLRAFGESGSHANRRAGRASQYVVAPDPRGAGQLLRNIKPGVYQRLAGGRLVPIIAFVRQPSYGARFDFYGVARRASLEAFPRSFPQFWAKALATAR